MSDYTDTNLGLLSCVPPSEFLELWSVCGPEVAKGYLAYVQHVVQYNAKALPLAYRVSKSNSAGSSGTVSTPSGHVPDGSRLDKIRGVKSWRKSLESDGVDSGVVVSESGVSRDGVGGDRVGSSVASSVGNAAERSVETGGQPSLGFKPFKYPDGYCYGKLLNVRHRQSVMLRNAAYPSLATISRLSAKRFQSLSELESFRLLPRAGAQHVAVGGTGGVSFLSAVHKYAASVKVLPGSLAASVLAAAKYGGTSVSVVGSDLIGGSGWDLSREQHRALAYDHLEYRDRHAVQLALAAFDDSPMMGVDSFYAYRVASGQSSNIDYAVLCSYSSSRSEFEKGLLMFYITALPVPSLLGGVE